ncbi:MAG: hypothetical protein V4683_08035 [Bacteroidota bacterium]
MKKLISIFALFFVFSTNVSAQKAIPIVDSKGHILNGITHIGKLSSAGSFDAEGKSMTHINSNGNIVDLNGKVLGKAPKNNGFTYYHNGKPEKYTIGKPSHNGMCEVKDSKGKTVMFLHNNYKNQAACAVHCLHENLCMPGDKPMVHTQ